MFGAKFKLAGESQAMLIKYAMLAALGYVAYRQIKSGVSQTIDLVSNIDLNPFDANGWLGLTVPSNVPQVSGYDGSHAAALAKLGADIRKYHVWYPNPLMPKSMPAGTLQVKWGSNKITYYAPNTGIDIFSL